MTRANSNLRMPVLYRAAGRLHKEPPARKGGVLDSAR